MRCLVGDLSNDHRLLFQSQSDDWAASTKCLSGGSGGFMIDVLPMTNLAPWFGVKVGEAYITASTYYMDAVALPSVVMFVPMFVGWVVILMRYPFSPFSVFLA